MLALSLVICSSTWWRTLGRSLSSATNAVKPTHESTCSQSIPEFTRPRSVLFFKCKFYVAKKSFRIMKYFQHNGFDPPFELHYWYLMVIMVFDARCRVSSSHRHGDSGWLPPSGSGARAGRSKSFLNWIHKNASLILEPDSDFASAVVVVLSKLSLFVPKITGNKQFHTSLEKI